MRRKKVNWLFHLIFIAVVGLVSFVSFYDFTPEAEDVEVHLTYEQLQKIKK
ncbi:MAG: hypothetical protein MJ250_03240 [Alphaproteobacteria bacterium]|nr:hypothetical protein [Alphaproteobacteria bacterium]